MLESILTPADLRRLSTAQAVELAAEIRQTLIDAVARNGGHLASNLGAVELTIALHRALNTPEDKIVFDVGHQSYTHKLLTGRRLAMLRAEGGVSGFPKRSESEYDVFETGHASTAISAALGLARARDTRGESHAVMALVGDGALTGGLCYEALNDAGSRPTQLVLLLNDNEMSIAANVGALSRHLTRLRGSRQWHGTKKVVKHGLYRVPLVGEPLARLMERMKRTARVMLVHGEFFEALGFAYLGPIDGHDIAVLEETLRAAREMNRPVVVHAVTQKGRGYALAERKPDQFHGVAPFFVESGKARRGADDGTVAAAGVVGKALVELGADSRNIVAITAAMPQGTGLSAFANAYPDRFFDVGIAEEHAVTLAAGMAAGGLHPVFAVYASFLQRACDQLLHDMCLQNLPGLVLVDHAGLVSGDGATHQGVYDLAMLRAMPNLVVWSPCDARELRAMIQAAFERKGPCVIRYPKQLPAQLGLEAPVGTWRCVTPGEQTAIVAHGGAIGTARETASLLRAHGVSCAVWSASSLLPLDEKALGALAAYPLLGVMEEEQVFGGMGEAVSGYFAARKVRPAVLRLGIEGVVPSAHSLEGLRRECCIDAESIAARMKEALHGE